MANLTIDQVKSLSKFERTEGRQQLASYLTWGEFHEDSDLRKSIQLDCLYDSLMFMIQKGFPWQHILSIFSISYDMLEESQGKSISDTIRIYTDRCKACTENVSEKNLKIFTDFFFSTFMQHYKLYQFVLTQDRGGVNPHYELPVECPESPPPLKDGTDISVWEYEKKIENIEKSEEKSKIEREKEKCEIIEKDKRQLLESYNIVDKQEPPLDKEKLSLIIKEIASSHITAVTHALVHNVKDTIGDLEFMLQKSSEPRPDVLGAPPRYRTKTPLNVRKPSKDTASKSAKSSRGSTKSAKK